MDNLPELFSQLSLEKQKVVLSLLQQLQTDSENNEENENSGFAKELPLCNVKEITEHKWINNKLHYTINWEDGETSIEPKTNLVECDIALFEYFRKLTEGNSVVLIYVRVSSLNNDYQISLQMQEKTCTEFCKKFGHTNVFVINEGYRSARAKCGKVRLPKLDLIVKTLARGDHLIVYDASRLSRNVAFGASSLDKLSGNGVTITSVSDKLEYSNKNTLDTATAKHNFHILLAQAEYESNKLSARSKLNIEFRKQRGDHIGAIPYGFKTVRKDDGRIILVTNDIEKKMIKEIQSDERSIKHITLAMNKSGRKKRKIDWTESMIRSIKKSKPTFNKHMTKKELVVDSEDMDIDYLSSDDELSGNELYAEESKFQPKNPCLNMEVQIK